MNFEIKDKGQIERFQELSQGERIKVEYSLKRHLTACESVGVLPEVTTTLKEAIDLVVAGNWEPDRPLERPEGRMRYHVYTPPARNAAYGRN